MKKLITLLFLLPFAVAIGQVEGTWKMAPVAGALGVGPELGNVTWWSNSAADVTTRACYFDDEYVFAEDGTFTNVVGDETWIEPWQGMDPEACGAPVAPHNGSNPATWSYDATAGTITLTGVGAYLGLPKVINEGEISDPADAPASITYPVEFTDDDNFVINISIATGYWRFMLTKGTPPPPPENTLVLPITFEEPEADYRLVGFGGTASEIIVDPSDATNHVLQTIKSETAETWAGTTIGEGPGLVDPVPFTAEATKMSCRVWSPAVGIPILFKLEDSNDASIAVETMGTTTVAESWEMIVFDFSNEVAETPPLDLNNSYNKPVVFFNFGVSGADAGALTFLWDDIKFGEGTDGIFENSIAQLSVYPNPANDILFIAQEKQWSNIQVYSVTGQLVFESNENLQSINVSEFKAGYYTLKGVDKDGNLYAAKFIKE